MTDYEAIAAALRDYLQPTAVHRCRVCGFTVGNDEDAETLFAETDLCQSCADGDYKDEV